MKHFTKLHYVFILILFVILVYNIGMTAVKNINEEVFTVTVKEKLRASYGHIWQTHKYLIFTVDAETDQIHVFENTDSPLHGKFNSSDYYVRLEPGRTYQITAVGYRVPFSSIYKNIIIIDPIDSTNEEDDR